MPSKTPIKRKSTVSVAPRNGMKQMAAGEFKAKCLAIIDEVNESGQEVIITKRGKAAAKLVPFANPAKKESIIGRLEGIGEIVGDPDDLIKPVFPLEDYDMLK
jgi:prevent-host-death family protein